MYLIIRILYTTRTFVRYHKPHHQWTRAVVGCITLAHTKLAHCSALNYQPKHLRGLNMAYNCFPE